MTAPAARRPPAGRTGGNAQVPPPDTPARRRAACCQSEPECVLCPLRPENAGSTLQDLWDRGLYANLPALGFRRA